MSYRRPIKISTVPLRFYELSRFPQPFPERTEQHVLYTCGANVMFVGKSVLQGLSFSEACDVGEYGEAFARIDNFCCERVPMGASVAKT